MRGLSLFLSSRSCFVFVLFSSPFGAFFAGANRGNVRFSPYYPPADPVGEREEAHDGRWWWIRARETSGTVARIPFWDLMERRRLSLFILKRDLSFCFAESKNDRGAIGRIYADFLEQSKHCESTDTLDYCDQRMCFAIYTTWRSFAEDIKQRLAQIVQHAIHCKHRTLHVPVLLAQSGGEHFLSSHVIERSLFSSGSIAQPLALQQSRLLCCSM